MIAGHGDFPVTLGYTSLTVRTFRLRAEARSLHQPCRVHPFRLKRKVGLSREDRRDVGASDVRHEQSDAPADLRNQHLSPVS